MKMVRFEDGLYGIRCGFIFKSYVDLKMPIYKWGRGSTFFKDCRGTFEEVKKVYDVWIAGEVVVDTNTGKQI